MLDKKGSIKGLLLLIDKTPDYEFFTMLEKYGYDMNLITRAFCEIQADQERKFLEVGIKTSKIYLGLNRKHRSYYPHYSVIKQ